MHNFPEMLSVEEKLRGVLVESIPIAEQIENKYSEAYYSYETQSVYYEYKDIPLSAEDQNAIEIAELKSQNAQMAYALMMGGLL